MFEQIIPMTRQTIANPQEGIGTVLSLGLDRSVLWPALAVIIALSVILSNVALVFSPQNSAPTFNLPQSPFLLAMVMAIGLVLTVFCTHYIGRAFGGSGRFTESLTIVIWLQTILLIAQIVQLGLLMISFGLANLFGIVVAVFGLWLFVNFVAVVHGFNSLLNVFAGIIVSTFGVLFGLSIFSALLMLILGLDIQDV